MTVDPKFSAVLRILYPPLQKKPVPIWAITGSLGFALQGMQVEVHDVDLQTDRAGAYEIERRFSSYVVRPAAFSGTERIRSHFGALEINGIKVEIMGDLQKRLPDGHWEDPVDVRRHLRRILWGGMNLPVLSMEYEYQAYRMLGREEQAERLRKWMDRRNAG
ncbi:MAG: hypothetical protein JW929_12900 [Anaerolineales bacterium]|nr:hypothetical protein [Anaerolineales bacterium]